MVALATQVKRRRGTTAQNDAFTGAEGEIVVDTEKHTLRVHDGVTLGGFEMARQADLNNKADTAYIDSRLASKANTDLSNVPDNYDYIVESQLPTADNGYTWYRKYKSGWVEQGGWVEGGDHITSNVVFPVPMANIYYALSFGGTENTNSTNSSTPSYRGIYKDTGTVSARSTTGFTLGNGRKISWNVSGMSAQ